MAVTNVAQFNGSNYFTANPAGSLNVNTTTFTMEAWVNVTNVNVRQFVMFAGQTGSFATYIMTVGEGGNGDFFTQMDSLGSPRSIDSGGGLLFNNTWAHIAITYDGSNLRTYLNGVLTNTQAVTGTITHSNNGFFLGTNQGSFNFWNGKMSMVRVWTVTRSAGQLLAAMCAPLGATTGLAAEWTLDGSLLDNSGNGNTLTDHGSVAFTTDTPPFCLASPQAPGQFSPGFLNM